MEFPRIAVASAAALFSLIPPAFGAEEAVEEIRLILPPEAPERFERIEIALEGVPPAENPFDPDAIAVDLEAKLPSGRTLDLPAFYFQDYGRRLAGNRETLTPEGKPGWRIRYLPIEAGRHELRVTARAGGKVVARGSGRVEVKGGGKRRGLIRVEETGKRYFRFDDGTPLFLNGLCACWHGRRGSYDYDEWLAAYEKAGINYIRLWMWHHAFGIEWDKGDRVRYRLDAARTLDRVLEEAERRGVHVMLCLDYHGIFEVKPDYWGGNNFWPRHPYNAANGGPCADQNEFFTKEEARALYRKRLRYIVARWSAFPNIFAWEFFNEIDNVYRYLKHEDVVAWHRDMGRHLRAIDPHAHLISSSFTGGSERGQLFDLAEMDFSQYHSYNEKHPADMMAQKAEVFFRRYRKPFFVSEYGTDFRGWKPDADPNLRALHQAIWSGAFTGAAGTGMTWWWESIHAANLYAHWSSLARFLEGTAIAQPQMAPASTDTKGGKAKAFAVATPREALVWLLDPAYDWPEGAMVAPPARLEGIEVEVAGLEDGSYDIVWWETLEGKVIAKAEAACASGRLRLAAPPFRADIACRAAKR
ncbi:MAG: cellulase family glycosylhydrolase [Planctomycetes bacterium]|nr:cellulase family glycosylhydrolase [Planctomycetota bacterium]